MPPTNVLIRFTNLTLGPVYDKADTACRSLGSALSDLTATAIIPGPWSLQLRRFGFEFAVSRSGCLLLPNSVDSHLIDSDSGSDADDEPENSKGCLWTQGLYCVPRDSGDIQVQAGTEVLPKHIMTLGHLIMRPQSEDTNHKHKTTTSIDTDDEAPFYFENKYWNPTGYQVVIDLQDSGLPVWIIRDEAWLENYERPYSFRNIIDAIGGKGMARFSAAKILSSCRDWQKKEVEESRGLIEQTRCWVRSARIDAWYSS
ncbi:hypothetical protein CkaCkLH20_10360 [Colletotrichum karsti]|uniref:Uncharacterized protein n=1 Tax=Colletotrichum karsti TaxID=1095194 RepID=A0A9P6HWS1_9PEZI|nr:uncharacterized protein CkaCkLH20_10360 [Colletotrichum karsti]KAF9872268.1 hypothetical protein CkaCkLH20_10360 [Colletotrichum karsti]